MRLHVVFFIPLLCDLFGSAQGKELSKRRRLAGNNREEVAAFSQDGSRKLIRLRTPFTALTEITFSKGANSKKLKATKKAKCKTNKSSKSLKGKTSTKAPKGKGTGVDDCEEETLSPTKPFTSTPTDVPIASPTSSPSVAPTTALPTTSPSVAPTAALPTASPTTAPPSNSPTLAPSNSANPSISLAPSQYNCESPAGRARDATMIASDISGTELLSPSSPQSSALEWLLNVDTSNACDSNNAMIVSCTPNIES